MRKMHQDLFEAELWLIEAHSELSILELHSSDVRKMLKEREDEIAKLAAEQKTQYEKSKKLQKEAEAILQSLEQDDTVDGELWNEWAQNPEVTLESIDAEIKVVETRMGLLSGGNDQAIRLYEERLLKIDALTKTIENFEGDLATLTEEIKTIRDQWEPKLDQLVSVISDAFSHNFARIGCAGEVGVHKDEEDFSAWAIQIQVRFR